MRRRAEDEREFREGKILKRREGMIGQNRTRQERVQKIAGADCRTEEDTGQGRAGQDKGEQKIEGGDRTEEDTGQGKDRIEMDAVYMYDHTVLLLVVSAASIRRTAFSLDA